MGNTEKSFCPGNSLFPYVGFVGTGGDELLISTSLDILVTAHHLRLKTQLWSRGGRVLAETGTSV